MTDVARRTIVVTGAGSGNGRAIAEGLAARGANVVVADLNGDAAEATVHAIQRSGGSAQARILDVRDPDSVAATFDGLAELMGLVNNAGILTRHDFLEMPVEAFDQLIAVNLRGYFLCAQAAARQMVSGRSKGAIVQIGSNTSRMARTGLSHYIASKGGVASLGRTLAVELAPYGIRVNTISPGVMRTELNRDRLDDPSTRDRVIASIPAGRLGAPQDLAGAAAFLLSAQSDFVTGADLVIDGGELAC